MIRKLILRGLLSLVLLSGLSFNGIQVSKAEDILIPSISTELDLHTLDFKKPVIEIDQDSWQEEIENEQKRLEQESEDSLPDVLKKIRWCESRDDYTAQNPISTASGAFQFINGTWNNYKGYKTAKEAPRIVQNEYALRIYSKNGTRDWLASASCWDKNSSQSSSLTVNTSTSGDRFGTPIIMYADYTNDCVTFAKNYTKIGIQRTIGDGARAGIQGTQPRIGSIGALKGNIPHAVVVTKIEGNQITFIESNYWKNVITQRTADLSMFIGFIYS